MSKKLLAAMQTEVIDTDTNSDCGTTKTIEINITNSNKNNYLYRYILEGSKLVELNDSNIDKYVGKTVKLRTPMYCKNDKICNKCAGNFIYKLGDVNVGLQCSKIATTLTQLGMKKFHVSNISTTKIDIDDLLI